ncbi:hypothetical protein SAMN05421736_10658 [Evansella caseinilytica]|uniref:Lipoprotein n=1 Tax=Evansella caseinilytica TaxID=1503961 RepID=A0A1H3Q9B1_9BACI|nr:hypothetical protein [Evansella caseinilytica]SDZ09605.1 hypothetical protein SAMN05421736_10658 [Evansella caseinilytica]
MKRCIKLFPFLILLLVMTGCNETTNYEADGPFIVVTSSPAGEDDFRNLFSRNYAIYENGKLIVYTEPESKLKVGDDAPVYESQLKEEEVDQLKQLIEKNKFWKFHEDLSDNDTQDGSFLYVTIHLTDQSKTVGGLNPNNPKFIEIADYVFDLISDDDDELWEEEITDHIFKMNP